MKAPLCTLFYILGCFFLLSVGHAPPVKMQTHFISIPKLKPKFVGTSIQKSDETNCLAKAIYHEGRGESIKTQVMIAEVTINRVKDSSTMFPYSICQVIHQRRTKGVCQYTWVCGRHPIKEKAAWIRSQLIAQWLYKHYYLERDIPDLTKGSLYFVTLETHRSWMDSLERKVKSDHMQFLAAD